MTAADATAYEMPMIASCGMFASWPLIMAKTSAPRIVNAEAHPVDAGRVRIAAERRHDHGDRRAERGDLRERQIDEDHAALDHVQSEIGMDAGDDQRWRRSAPPGIRA